MTKSRSGSAGATKERLLEAAVESIASRGYAASTARHVTGAAGANLASIGYHFGGMQDLLDEALIVATDRWLGPQIEMTTLVEGASVRDRVVSGLMAFVASLPANRNTAVGFFEALARAERSDVLRGRLAEGYETLRSSLAAVVTDDAAYREAAVGGASAVIALYDGVMVQWLLDPHRSVDVESMVDGLGEALRPKVQRLLEATVLR